jgi:hypothetical protein
MRSTVVAAVLLTSSSVAVQAVAQSPLTKAAEAQRLQKLKAQRDAAVAAEKARQNTINRPAPTAAPTPTVAPTTTPPTVTTTRPTATTTPTTAPTAPATPTATTAATAAGGAPATTSSATTPAASTSAAPKPPPALGLDLEELKKTRPDRRKAEVSQLKARWGELLRDSRAADELKQHAQRTAYLQRIRALASKANDAKTVQAVDILITKEDGRNADAMNALRSGALPAPIAGAAK